MLRLLRKVSLPQLRASWGRTSLVVAGVATGVSLIVAIEIINTSVLANFRESLEEIAGPAQLEVTLGVGEIGFDESALDVVRADPDVEAAVPLVHGTVALAAEPSDGIQLFGVDLLAEQEWGRYEVTLDTERGEMLEWVADPHSIALTRALAEQRGIAAGDSVELSTPRGFESFTVRGLLEAKGLARAFAGRLALMDLPAAQLLLAKTGRIDQIDVMLKDGTEVDRVRERLQATVPGSLSVARPQRRGELYEQIIAAFQAQLTGLSALCLIAAVFIIYNTTSTGALQRARSMGQLRVLGADAGQLFRLFMLEAAILGAVGALVGVALGIGLARLLTGLVSDSMGVVFALRFSAEVLEVDAAGLGVAVAVGVAAALFASYFAARRTSHIDPLDIVRPAEAASRANISLRLWLGAWVGMVAVSVAALAIQVRLQSFTWGNLGSTLWNASVIVVAVPLVAASAATLSRILQRFFGAEGRVAADGLFRRPARTGMTIAAVTLVLAIAITVASLTLSFQKSVSSYFTEEGFLIGDLVVSAVSTEGGGLETPLPAAIVAELRDLQAVREAEAWRLLYGQMYEGERIALLALSDGFLDPERYGERWYEEGDPTRAAIALREGKGANVSVALAQRHGLHVGDRIELESPTGIVAVPIVGVVHDYISDRGTVVLSRDLLVDRWREPGVTRVHLSLAPGVPIEKARAQIQEHFGDRYLLKILSLDDVIAEHEALIVRGFAFTDAIKLLVAIVTVAGIFDLLLAAIVERRREIALWRLIGAGDEVVRRSVVIESATIGAIGAGLGIVVGLVTAWIWIGINYRYLVGFHLDFHVAIVATAWSVVLVMVMTVVAGYSAARQATRQTVLEGIRTE